MATVKPVVQVELDPLKPVPEICAVIASVLPYHPGQEDAILKGVQEAIQRHRNQIAKGAEGIEQVRESNTEQKDK